MVICMKSHAVRAIGYSLMFAWLCKDLVVTLSDPLQCIKLLVFV